MYNLFISYGNVVESFFGISFERAVNLILEHSKQNGYTVRPTESEIRKFKNIIDRGYKKTFTTVNGSEITIKPAKRK